MKKLYVRYVSYMCIFAMMFLSVAPLLSVTLVSAEQINDSATTESHLFESSDFNLVIDKEKLKSDDDQIWEIKISSVSPKLEGLAIRIKNEQQTWLTEVKRDQQILQSNAKGLFILTPEETRLTFNANENTHIIVDIFKIVDGNESFLGTVKHEEDAEQVENTDETETPLEDGESSEELETSETDELYEESNTSEENDSYTTSTGEEKSHVIDRTTETNVNVKSPNGNTGNPNVPKGAIELGDIFGGLNIKGGSGNSNSGVVNITDPNENNGVPYSEIRLSGQNNWLSIWSKDRYKMDFSKSFQGRTYINFGTKDADGLAFVMQNEGPKALTTANTDKDGQNLGVYGSSKKGFLETPNPAKNAIKNSVAIEFDLHLNNSGDTLFDNDVRTNPHMAYTFPGNNNGYSRTSLGYNVVNHNKVQQLNGVVGANVRDGTWYEFRYDFDETKKNFTYYLKNPISSKQTEPVTIPWQDLERELNLKNNDYKAYWGFTGANGRADGQVKFVFTQVPVDLSARMKNDVQVNDKTVVDNREDEEEYDPSIPIVKKGDEVTFQTEMTVDEGEAGLDNVTWHTTITPKHFDLNEEIHATAKIKEGAEYTGLVNRVNKETGEVEVSFSPELKIEPGQTVTMIYKLTPSEHKEPQKVHFTSKVSAKEIGNQTPIDIQSHPVAFWISGNQAPILKELKSSQEIYTDYLDEFAFKFQYADPDKDHLTCTVKVNNHQFPEFDLDSTTDLKEYSSSENLKIDLLVENNIFKLGENELTVTLDDGNNEPVSLTTTFTIEGYLGFEELTENFSWKYARKDLSSQEKAMAREEDMKIKIRDTRSQPSNSLYLTFNANSENKLLSQDRFMFSDEELDKIELDKITIPTNKTQEYDKNKGLLLKLSNKDVATSAKGTITWTIVDAL